MNVPSTREALKRALTAQREYTLALHADLPSALWQPARVPYSAFVNPPLWELAHLAWFQEFFCLRWQPDDVEGRRRGPLLAGADALFNSSLVPHLSRWSLDYPPRETLAGYMRDTLALVVSSLDAASDDVLSRYQLALLHEDMHGEAFIMTRLQLGLGLPEALQLRRRPVVVAAPLSIAAGVVMLGAVAEPHVWQFDNELPAEAVQVDAFEIDAHPVTAGELSHWRGEPCPAAEADLPAMHVPHAEAEAYAAAQGRRLPTEAEWEAAARLEPFRASTGDVWEWTSSVFDARPGFIPGPYRDYSAPWFPAQGVVHMVLKGGSFAAHPRLKYPQYRNFYVPDRRDLFAGFRTCRSR